MIKHYYRMFKRWALMFMGQSQFHQEQSVGKNLSATDVSGYPSDLTDKINWKGDVDEDGIIINELSSGDKIYFPIAVAQKALGHHDQFLSSGNCEHRKTFLKYCDFLSKKIDDNGLIETWHKQDREVINNFSSMTQGQAISCFCRAYLLTNEDKYLDDAESLFKGLLDDRFHLAIEDSKGRYAFSEMPNVENIIILNGWIFTLWGIFDLAKVTARPQIKEIFDSSVEYLSESLCEFSTGYWSKYDNGGKIASPFYHQLHIHQLRALYYQTQNPDINKFANNLIVMQENRLFKIKAIFLKSLQKLSENRYNEFV